MKIAYLFAGQGQQFPGMGYDLAQEYSIVSETFQQASAQLGYDLLDVCQNNPDDKLSNTIYTQPAILTLSTSILRVLNSWNIEGVCVAGLSLGEYSAIVASGVLSFDDALNIIKERAQIMDSALEKGSTGMAAVLRADLTKVEEVLKDESLNGKVAVCNINTFDQIVVGGKIAELDKAIEILKESGFKRVIKLNVSTVSHMHLLNDASLKLEVVLNKYSFNKPQIKFINNVNASYQVDGFVDSLVKQIAYPTKMADTIKLMLESGIDTFVEIGPGNALSGFVKSIAKVLGKEVAIYNISDVVTLNKFKENMGEKYE